MVPERFIITAICVEDEIVSAKIREDERELKRGLFGFNRIPEGFKFNNPTRRPPSDCWIFNLVRSLQYRIRKKLKGFSINVPQLFYSVMKFIQLQPNPEGIQAQ